MAQSSSAVREPSMEEILASIRKIIEDSDTAQPQEQTPASPHAGADVKTFPRMPNAAAEAPQGADDEIDADEPAPVLNPVNLNHDPKSAAGSDTAKADSDWPLEAELSAAMAELEPVSAVVGEAAAVDDAGSDDLGDGDDVPLAAQDSHGPVREAETVAGKAIVSPTTVRQVAAAFEDLNQAMAAESRRSFDEIAEDILRPMLQEWLDDNLPTLVERLVREEIQRVVRGTRG